MRISIQFALLFFLGIAPSFAREAQAVDLSQLPEGWVQFNTPEDRGIDFVIKKPPFFGNLDGTIWIYVQTLTGENEQNDIVEIDRFFEVLESGSTPDFRFTLLQDRKNSGASGSLFLFVHEIRTMFGILITENGSTDYEEFRTNFRRPSHDDHKRLLQSAKQAIFAIAINSMRTEQGAAANP